MLSYASLSATLLFGVSVVISSVIINTNSSKMIDHVTKKATARAKTVIDTPKILAVTRIHKGSSTEMARVESVLNFVRNAVCFASKVLICVGNDDTKERMEYIDELNLMLDREQLQSKVILLSVSPWGHFTFPLNCAISRAVDDGFNIIAFQSLEFRISTKAVGRLVEYLQQPDTLVVGPAISGHDFIEGINVLRGRTCPWNTFAVWSVQYLSLIGFPPVGDGDGMKREKGGVEEVTAINMIQHIKPYLRAVLVRMKGVEWETNFTDPVRLKYHEKKMRSKDERPADQMLRLGIPYGNVLHVLDE